MNLQFTILNIDSCTSTNTYLQTISRFQKEGTVIYTDHQTEGKGQKKRKWYSSKGKNLTFSILLKPTFLNINNIFLLNKIISIATLDGINNFLVSIYKKKIKDLKIKWPNDIYWEKSKVGGILIENQIYSNNIHTSIVGIGININESNFPMLDNIIHNITSIKNILNSKIDLDRKLVLNFILESIKIKYKDFIKKKISESEIQKSYLKYLLFYDKYIKYLYKGQIYEGYLKDISDNGSIIIKKNDRLLFFRPTEIKLCT